MSTYAQAVRRELIRRGYYEFNGATVSEIFGWRPCIRYAPSHFGFADGSVLAACSTPLWRWEKCKDDHDRARCTWRAFSPGV